MNIGCGCVYTTSQRENTGQAPASFSPFPTPGMMPGQNRTDPHEFLWSTVMGTFHQKKSQAEMKPDTRDKPKIVCLARTQGGCEPVGYCSWLSYSSLMSILAEELPGFCVPHAVPCSDYDTVGSPFLCGAVTTWNMLAGEEPRTDAEMTRHQPGLRTGHTHCSRSWCEIQDHFQSDWFQKVN